MNFKNGMLVGFALIIIGLFGLAGQNREQRIEKQWLLECLGSRAVHVGVILVVEGHEDRDEADAAIAGCRALSEELGR